MSPVMPSHSSGSQHSDALSQAEQLQASPQREGDVSGLSVDVSALSADVTREGGVELGSTARDGDTSMNTILEDSVCDGDLDMDIDK